jgi:ATP/maltotriose-dependent transcriptional regulator MalT
MRTVCGRGAELAVLREFVRGASSGTGGVVRVEGPAGIGKSTLLAMTVRMADEQGLRVAAGTADELDQVTPWGPLLRAFSGATPPLLGQAELDSLRGSPDQRAGAVEVLRAALEHISPCRGILVAIDDLQWADAATLHALSALTDQLFSYPIAWLLTCRPVPALPPLESLLARLDRTGATVLRLEPLTPEAVRELAADLLGSRLEREAAELAAQAAGNPLFVIELLRAWADKAHPPGRPPPQPGEAMDSVRGVVIAYLRSLSASARQFLAVASVLGREFSAAEVAEMTGQPATRWLSAITEALAADVLTEVGDRLAFRHDVLRQSVYEDLPRSARHALHRDAATALRRLGEPAARVATHLVVAAQPGDEEAVEVLSQAAGEMFAAMPRAAADLAVRVLELMTDDDPRRPPMIARTVEMLGWVRRLDEARALGEGHLASHPAPPGVAGSIMLGVRRAWATRCIRPYPSPLPHWAVSDPAIPAGTRANLIAFEQTGTLYDGDTEAAEQALDAAAELIADNGDPADRAAVDYFRTLCAQQSGQLGAALDRAQAGLTLVHGERAAPITAILQTNLAICLGGVGRSDEALASLGSPMGVDESVGLAQVTIRCQCLRAAFLLDLGRLDDARSEARAGAAAATSELSLDNLVFALGTLAEAAVLQEDLAEARHATDRLQDSSLSPLWVERYWAAALVADATGSPGEALAALEPVFGQLRSGRFMFAARHPDRLPRAAGIALRAGNRAQAEAAANASIDLAERTCELTLEAAAAHARGLVADDPGQLRRAVELSEADKRPLPRGRIREDLGLALLRAGSKAEAVTHLDAAYSVFADCGSHRETRRVRARLRSLGVRKRQAAVARPDRGWESLTKSELAVVQLVVEGRTNREAAAALFVSPDTINTHLRHAFIKLGIRSRVELTRLALARPQRP